MHVASQSSYISLTRFESDHALNNYVFAPVTLERQTAAFRGECADEARPTVRRILSKFILCRPCNPPFLHIYCNAHLNIQVRAHTKRVNIAVGKSLRRVVHYNFLSGIGVQALRSGQAQSCFHPLYSPSAMKHGVAFRKFSRTSSHRMLMLRYA